MREKRLAPSRLFAWITVLVFVLSLAPVAIHAGTSADDLAAEISQLGLRARGLTLAALRQLKEIDTEFRMASGEPRPDLSVAANQRMWETKKLIDAFDKVSAQIRDLKSEFDKVANQATDDQRRSVEAVVKETNKYDRHLDRFYGDAVRDFGEPRPVEIATIGTPQNKNVVLRGEAKFGLGSSKYKRPAVVGVDFSGSELELGVNGNWRPAPPVNVAFNFNHQNTTERREIGVTDFGATSSFAVSPAATIRAGFAYQGYDDKENDLAKFGDTRLNAGFNYRGEKWQIDAGVEKRDRSFDENEAADFGSTRLNATTTLLMDMGHLRFTIDHLSKNNDVDSLRDARDLNARVQLRFAGGKTELNVGYRSVSYPNIDEEFQGVATIFGVLPEDNNKISAQLQFLSTSGTKTRRQGPKVILYQYPNGDDKDIYDIGYDIESRARGERMSTFRFNALTRLYKDTLQHDYAQLKLSRASQPIGVGGFSQWSLTARYYLTSPDEDDPFRLAKLPPPHTLDLYYTAGWGGSSGGSLRQWSIGPILGGTFFIDPEREDAYEDDDNNLIFPHPANVATVGVASRWIFVFSDWVNWDLDARYELDYTYASDPTSTNGKFKLRSKLGYTLDERIAFDGVIDYRMARADFDSPSDYDDYTIKVTARYLFEVER